MEESKKLDKKKVIEFLQKKHAENLDTSPEKARPFAEAIGKLSGWDENEELPTELQAVLDKLVIDQGRFTRSNQEVPTQPEFYIPKVVEASQKRLRLADLETDAFTEMPAAPPTPADDSAGAASPS